MDKGSEIAWIPTASPITYARGHNGTERYIKPPFIIHHRNQTVSNSLQA